MNNVILIFRTSVSNTEDMEHLSSVLNKCPQIKTWSIDLEDWEKVLRIECSKKLESKDISMMLKDVDIYISELEYLKAEKNFNI